MESNMNTYYFTENFDPLKHMNMQNCSTYLILSSNQEKQYLKHIHYSVR